MQLSDVRLSVPSSLCMPAVGLLLLAWWAGDINQLLQQWQMYSGIAMLYTYSLTVCCCSRQGQ